MGEALPLVEGRTLLADRTASAIVPKWESLSLNAKTMFNCFTVLNVIVVQTRGLYVTLMIYLGKVTRSST